jgi:hypothetical protein
MLKKLKLFIYFLFGKRKRMQSPSQQKRPGKKKRDPADNLETQLRRYLQSRVPSPQSPPPPPPSSQVGKKQQGQASMPHTPQRRPRVKTTSPEGVGGRSTQKGQDGIGEGILGMKQLIQGLQNLEKQHQKQASGPGDPGRIT